MQRRQPYFPLCSFKNNGSWGRFGDGSEKSTTEAEGCGWLKEPRRVEFNALSGLREPPSLLFLASEVRHLPRARDYIMIFAPRWVAPALLWRRRVPASFVTVLIFSSWLPFFVSFFNSSLFHSVFLFLRLSLSLLLKRLGELPSINTPTKPRQRWLASIRKLQVGEKRRSEYNVACWQ